MTTSWRQNPGGVALADHDYEMETEESRTSPETTTDSSEFSGSPGPEEHGREIPNLNSRRLLAYSSSPEQRDSPIRFLDKHTFHLRASNKRRRVNSEPAGELVRLVTGRGGLLFSGQTDGRGRKPRAEMTLSESDSAPIGSGRDRKKEQNKDAAKRYRQRKKSDRFVLDYELQREAGRNSGLNREIESLTQQINCLKRCLREAAALGGAAVAATANRDSPLGILAEVAAAQIPHSSQVKEEEIIDVESDDQTPEDCATAAGIAALPANTNVSLHA